MFDALTPKDLPGTADLAWASFPCQDLVPCRRRRGTEGRTFRNLLALLAPDAGTRKEGRAPSLIVLENVCGALASHDGKDFAAIGAALAGGTLPFWRRGDGRGAFRAAIAAKAVHRMRCAEDLPIPSACRRSKHCIPFGILPISSTLTRSFRRVEGSLDLVAPAAASAAVNATFSDIIEEEPQGVAWHTQLKRGSCCP